MVLGALLGQACAFGASPDPATTFMSGPGTPPATDDGMDDDDGETTMVFEEEGDEEPASSSGVAGDTTGDPMPGTTGGDDDSSTGSSGGGCVNTGTCPSASPLGSVSGDEASSAIMAMGDEPTWVTFLVTEDDDSAFGSGMSFTVTLQSPPGADFDLYVFRGIEGGGSGCGGFMQQSNNTGASDVVSMSWGEGGVANGSDDSAWIAVEIVAKDEVCAPPLEWSLSVQGNT